MQTATLRASYSISSSTLQRFNAVIPPGERSRVIESYMQQALAAKENELAKLAEAYLNDPAFEQCREDEGAWEQTASDGFSSAAVNEKPL